MREILAAQDGHALRCETRGEFEVYAASGNTLRLADGTLLAWAGTLAYRGLARENAAQQLAADLRQGVIDETALFGAFACAVVDEDGGQLLSDWLGNFRLFRNRAGTAWSSSFLASCAAEPAASIDATGAWEYILHGACFGADTPVAGVSRVAPDRSHGLGDKRTRIRPLALEPGPVPHNLAGAARQCLDRLAPVFDAIASHWGDGVDSALSGGYDSRLILALLRARGIAAHLHVYGRDSDVDVQLATAIAAGENLLLEHVDKSRFSNAGPVAASVRQNFLRFDALPPDGIFDHGADLATRLARMRDGRLLLNGGGGEIFRNFFYLPDRPFTALDLTRCFYSQFDPDACAGGFDLHRHRETLARKLAESVGADRPRLSRRQVEMSYPLFRCRYWMSGNSSINARLGDFLTPLVEPTVLRAALDVPLRFKNDGLLQAEMIRQADPRLAVYPSGYGHGFAVPPPAKARLLSALNRRRPLWLREHAFRIKQGLRRGLSPLPEWQASFGACLDDPALPRVRRLVHPERLSDPAMLRRAASLEYLYQYRGLG